MASYRGHLAVSTTLGVAYAGAGVFYFGTDLPPALLAGAVTAVSGLLPDLDSDSGVPIRVLFNLAAVFVPLLLLSRLLAQGMPVAQVLVILAALYFLIRHGAAAVFKRMTVHRGMFHSIPAMLIAGLAVFLLYHDPEVSQRWFLAGGAMVGFLSHLVLDELCNVDLLGGKLRLKKHAGPTLKFASSSLQATVTAYVILAGLGYMALNQPDAATLQQPARVVAHR